MYRELDTIIWTPADLGAVIRKRRKALGYTQAQVAEFNACSIRFISEIERGKAGANLRQTIAVANSMGIDLIARERGEAEWV